MHALTWVAWALGCGALWVVKELVGPLAAQLAGALLGWIFSPLRRAIAAPAYHALVRGLAGPAGGTRLAALTATFVVTAVGGGALVATAGSSIWLAAGACGAVAGLGALLVLDAARNEVKRQPALARAGPCPSPGARVR